MLFEPAIGLHTHLGGLNHGDTLHTATNDDVHAVGNHLLGRRGDRHHARGTLTVERHARNCDRQTCAHSRLACNVATGMALLEGGTDDAILNFQHVYTGTLYRVLDGMGGQRLWCRVVESTAIGFANWGTGRGYDYCVTHG